MTRISAGYLPLIDCATLILARELGLDRRHGIALDLHREPSWASIRDRMAFGAVDCAHMLAPMPLASRIGLTGPQIDVVIPQVLSLNGNVIVASNALLAEMMDADAAATIAGGHRAAKAVADVVARRARAGRPQVRLGTVFPFSCHTYDLRYWLARVGVDPDRDVEIIVVPPPLLADHLAEGSIDGFCVGAPWGMVSAAAGRGQVIATKGQLWPMSPEKVLGVRESWATREPDALLALIRTLDAAAAWLAVPSNRIEAAHVLAQPEYIGLPASLLLPPLSGELPRSTALGPIVEPDFIVFPTGAASCPQDNFALWLLSQMARWGQTTSTAGSRDLVAAVIRADLHAAALGLPPPAPTAAPLSIFGSDTFDPAVMA